MQNLLGLYCEHIIGFGPKMNGGLLCAIPTLLSAPRTENLQLKVLNDFKLAICLALE